MDNEHEILFFDRIKEFFKKRPPVKVDDIGIYHDQLMFNTLSNTSHSSYYQVFVKIRVVGVYDDLVEIEVIDVNTPETISDEMHKTFFDHKEIKYLKTNKIKWQTK